MKHSIIYIICMLLATTVVAQEQWSLRQCIDYAIAHNIDIKLQDYNGATHDLQQVAAAHRMVLLNFTVYQADFSPVFNKLLNDLYTKYKGSGLEIYQVSLDADNVAWRTAAQPLPWITVYDPMGEQSSVVGSYNVTGVPTTFVILNGEVVERIEDGALLPAAVARRL